MPLPRGSIQLLMLVVLAISGCKTKGVKAPEGDVLAALAPLPTADDSTFDAQSFRGKPTLVMFASPVCGYCMAELPIAVKAAAAEHANFVTVFIVGAKKHAASVKKTKNLDTPVLVDETGDLRRKYDIQGVPYTVILGADGHAREAYRGQQDEETLRDALADAR
jgi:thiol-disulfide isomerase/thioredoxin